MLQNQLHMLQEETVAARQQLAASQHSCMLPPRDDQHQVEQPRLEVVLAMQQVCVCVCVGGCVCVCACVCVCVCVCVWPAADI